MPAPDTDMTGERSVTLTRRGHYAIAEASALDELRQVLEWQVNRFDRGRPLTTSYG